MAERTDIHVAVGDFSLKKIELVETLLGLLGVEIELTARLTQGCGILLARFLDFGGRARFCLLPLSGAPFLLGFSGRCVFFLLAEGAEVVFFLFFDEVFFLPPFEAVCSVGAARAESLPDIMETPESMMITDRNAASFFFIAEMYGL